MYIGRELKRADCDGSAVELKLGVYISGPFSSPYGYLPLISIILYTVHILCMTKTPISENLKKRERITKPHQFFNKNSFRFVFFFLIISGSFLFFGVGKASAYTFTAENGRSIAGSSTVTITNAICTGSATPFSYCTGSGTGTTPGVAAGDTIVLVLSWSSNSATASVSDGTSSFTMYPASPINNGATTPVYDQVAYLTASVATAAAGSSPTYAVTFPAGATNTSIRIIQYRASGGLGYISCMENTRNFLVSRLIVKIASCLSGFLIQRCGCTRLVVMKFITSLPARSTAPALELSTGKKLLVHK